MSLVTLDRQQAADHIHKFPFDLKHDLAGHPLFSLERLVALAKSMPRDRIEYNSGKVAIGQAPDQTPQIDLPADDVIRQIEHCNAWMVIKNVETDTEYRALLQAFVRDLAGATGAEEDQFGDLQGFVFVSSAGSTTPFHIDAEENILVQISGDKFVHVFDNEDRALVSEEAMEISPSKHRNQTYEPAFESHARVFELAEGDAVHIPYMHPHWVRTGGRYCISMAMTWKTPEVERLNKIRLMNGTLRRFGLPQSPPGRSGTADAIKVFGHDAMRAVIDPLRKSEWCRKALRGLIYGRNANYYYEAGKGS